MAAKAQITVEQFELLEPRNDARFELVGGEVVELASASWEHNKTRDWVLKALDSPVVNSGGEVIAEQPFRVDSNQVRHIDVGALSKLQLPLVEPQRMVQPFTPTLAVEIAAPSDTLVDIFTKALDYLRADTEMVWIVVLQPFREVHVLDRSGAHRVCMPGESITLPASLGTATLPVAGLFPPPLR